jgi:hypothetical protein
VKGLGSEEGGFEDELDFGGVVEDGVGVGEGDGVVLGVDGLLGEEGLGFGDLPAVGIFFEKQFEVGMPFSGMPLWIQERPSQTRVSGPR